MEAPSPKELETEHAKVFYKSCLDIVDTLLTKTPESNHADAFAEKIRDFSANQTLDMKVFPKEGGWPSYYEWKPGEHSGFVILIKNNKDEAIFINVYGGLRIGTEKSDLRDSDKDNRRIHNFRTDNIICDSTEISLTLNDNSGERQTRVVFKRVPNKSFFLKFFKIKTNKGLNDRSYPNEEISYGHSDYHFDQVSKSFSESCNYFVGSVKSFLRN
jgi:hypothetical protein